MFSTNARGQYGAPPRIGAEARPYSPAGGSSHVPWMLGGVGLAVIGLAMIGTHVAKRPRLSMHEKEVRAWETEFPGLPWYMDQVKDARQLDMWERARDHWERTR
jgi:hypothetical protein